VHRDYADTMDVSADLFELARTPIAVVCAGVKSILDVGKTLEHLETLGVCVATLDPSGSSDFPAFFTRKSGFQSPFNCRSELDAASLVHSSLLTGLGSGVLIGVPVPSEYASDDVEVENAIRFALEEARRLNIRGKKVTD
jgi:pseudouridine-5'-phosphate glycosidase